MRKRLVPLLILCATFAATGIHAQARLDQLQQTWIDDDGKAIKLPDLHGRRVILTMAYATCHKFCPMTIDQLKQMQQRLDRRGEQADFVIVGYDPDNDDPWVWHQYRLSRRLNRSNWHFLSGTRAATEQLAQACGFGFWKYDEHVMHESRGVIFDTEGRQSAAMGPETRHWADKLEAQSADPGR